MHTLLMATAFLLVQESTSTTNVATPDAERQQMVDVRIRTIGLKQGLEIPEVISSPEEFLNDPQTKENILWTTDFRGSTLAGRQLMLTTGEIVPTISGVNITGQGRRMPQVTMMQAGTVLRLTPKVSDGDQISLKLQIEASRIDRGAQELSEDTALLQNVTHKINLETEIALTNGQTKVMSNSQMSSDPKNPAEQALILVMVKLVE